MQYFKSDYMEGAHPLILEIMPREGALVSDEYGENFGLWHG